ncbi:hypothetical protein L8106_12795 [Lyngbya sp. PCC 8106]|nr:hypothetical protein L8106_12795 [Lyngbya sp. PCC 8106]
MGRWGDGESTPVRGEPALMGVAIGVGGGWEMGRSYLLPFA